MVTSLSANNVSIVVCSSLLTSSNMSKNFSIPGIPFGLPISVSFVSDTGDGGE